MPFPRLRRLNAVFAATVAGFFLSACPTLAVGPDDSNAASAPTAGDTADTPENKGNKAKAKAGTKSDDKESRATKPKSDKKSRLEDRDDFRAAHALIKDGQYETGITALRALRHDSHAEVANLLGFANRKLGHYDEAKFWYETALEANPRHARTWSYYGMWHAEQGNRLKAEDYLEKVRAICGTECREYAELKGVIEGTFTY
jgi:tetratricopeptide (TPR) repeat protein